MLDRVQRVYRVYRISDAAAWTQVQITGELPLGELDRLHGYIHLSTAAQLAGTLARYFAGREDLVLLTIDPDRLPAESLRIEAPAEPGRAHERYPHLYGRLPRAAIVAAEALPLDADGQPRLPPGLA